MPVVECDPDEARQRLAAVGITIEPGNTSHEQWRATHGDATAVAYIDKIVVQGRSPYDLLAHLEEGPRRAYLYFDGASRGNPGPAAIGWVIVADGGIVAENGQQIGNATNNQAEYEALLAGLEAAVGMGIEELIVQGDSELIIKQVRGEYETRNPELRERRIRVNELLDELEAWELNHVPRGVNDRADKLANEALDG